MADNSNLQDFNSYLRQAAGNRQPNDKPRDSDEGEAACLAFGYLRGLNSRALAVEFRFRTGDSEFHAYNCLTSWRRNPSVGLLLKFTGDVTTLVLIRGSNLDALVSNSVNLLQGLQRHRILWLREMDEDELRRAGKGEPTIDRIEISEAESQEEIAEWLKRNAAAFVRPNK
jgi:hypothetical protein